MSKFKHFFVVLIAMGLLIGLSPAAQAAYVVDWQWKTYEQHTLYIGEIAFGNEPNDIKSRVRCNSNNARFVHRAYEEILGIWVLRGNPKWAGCDESVWWNNVLPIDGRADFKVVVTRGYYGRTPINAVAGASLQHREA